MSYYTAEMFIIVLQVVLHTTAVMSHIVRNCTTYDTSNKFPWNSIVFHHSHVTLYMCVKLYGTFLAIRFE